MRGEGGRARRYAAIRLALAVTILLAVAIVHPAVAADQRERFWGILSEARFGLLWHDPGVFGSNREVGADINAEILFVSPRFLEIVWSPRPHLGMSVNTAGATSQLYGGLTWGWTFWDPFFLEGSFGFSVHNGKLNVPEHVRDRKSLGCRVLFRESVSLGVYLGKHHSLSAMLDHISNARLCNRNDGLDTVGVRYGYRF